MPARREPMRIFLRVIVFLLIPALASAQAQGGPDPAPLNPPPDLPLSPTPAPAPAPGPAAAPAPAAAAAAASASAPPPRRPSPPPAVSTRTGLSYEEAEARWKFSYHGYLRAPMRIGFGKRLPEDTAGYTIANQTDTTIHEATVPDDQVLSFQSTIHNPRSWAEGFFHFGNGVATGVLGIGSYNLTEGGFNDFRANWGISQAYVLLTPELGYENVRLWAKAGAIVDKYGTAGRYDPGEYDTYMFGRTHVVGETFHLDYDLDDIWTLSLEQGLGTHKPDPNKYNTARYTMLHHEHVGLKQGRDLEFGAHYLMSWSQEEYRFQRSPSDAVGAGSADADAGARNGLPNGKLWVAGVEARAELGAFGYFYGAYSHVRADYALTVSRAIELLNSSGGGEFDLGVVSNYLDSPRCSEALPATPPPTFPSPPENWKALDRDGCSDGNGYLNALQGHYEFSLTNFEQQISGGPRFWGQGFDAIVKLYGLVVFANSEARDTTKVSKTGGPTALESTSLPTRYAVTKAKFGADLAVQALPWLTPGLRFDRVMPNNHVGEQSFAVLSPRISFKSDWVTHERLTVGFSRYFYDRRVCQPRVPASPSGGTLPDASQDPLAAFRCTQAPPSPVPYDGFGSTTAKQDAGNRATGVVRPDENVFKVEATMWW